MRYIYLTGLALLMILQCPVNGYTLDGFGTDPATESISSDSTRPKKIHPDKVPKDSAETARMWKMARHYKNQMRYELARQYYLLALSTCRSNVTVERIQRELQIVELQIRTLR